MEEVIFVQKNSLSRIKYIILSLESDTVNRKWSLIGSENVQETSNTYGYINKGKANELSPEEAAKIDFNRIIAIKLKEGYLKTNSLDTLPDFNNDNMDFDNLPVQFCCSKPHTSITESKCNKLIKDKLLRFFIKENGLCHFILVTSTGEIKIYSRRLDLLTVKYPAIVEAVKNLELPNNTLIIAEFVIDPDLEIPHMESFQLMSSISRSDTLSGAVKENVEKTLELQKKHKVTAVLFNILFMDGIDTTALKYEDILEKLSEIDKRYNSIAGETSNILLARELKFESFDDAWKWAQDNTILYEGLVAWNIEENAEITYNGKPNRRACYKLKAEKEDDVIAYDWKEGTGAKQGKVGSLYIGKYNKERTEIIPFGRVGSGLKIKQGECEIDYWKLPCVIEISYDQRFPTGKYQFPRFTGKIHLEKIPSDIVVNDKGF